MLMQRHKLIMVNLIRQHIDIHSKFRIRGLVRKQASRIWMLVEESSCRRVGVSVTVCWLESGSGGHMVDLRWPNQLTDKVNKGILEVKLVRKFNYVWAKMRPACSCKPERGAIVRLRCDAMFNYGSTCDQPSTTMHQQRSIFSGEIGNLKTR